MARYGAFSLSLSLSECALRLWIFSLSKKEPPQARKAAPGTLAAAAADDEEDEYDAVPVVVDAAAFDAEAHELCEAGLRRRQRMSKFRVGFWLTRVETSVWA